MSPDSNTVETLDHSRDGFRGPNVESTPQPVALSMLDDWLIVRSPIPGDRIEVTLAARTGDSLRDGPINAFW